MLAGVGAAPVCWLIVSVDQPTDIELYRFHLVVQQCGCFWADMLDQRPRLSVLFFRHVNLLLNDIYREKVKEGGLFALFDPLPVRFSSLGE